MSGAASRRQAEIRMKFERQSLSESGTKTPSGEVHQKTEWRSERKVQRDINGNVNGIATKEQLVKQTTTTEARREGRSRHTDGKIDLTIKTGGLRSTTIKQERPQSLEAKMLERRRQREKEQKQKTQQQQQNRNMFKQKLEENSPKPDPSKTSVLKRGDSNIDRLLRWVQKRVNPYPGVSVTDFSSSWSDGMAFCALMHVLVPDKISVDDLDPADRRKNFELAFSVATAEGVPELLDVEDMVRVSVPGKQSVVTYVHTIYKVMILDKQEEEKKKS